MPNPDETDRVRRHTPDEVNAWIDAETHTHLRYYAGQPKAAIARRIDALDREWDIERILETNAAALSLLGLLFSKTRNRNWLLLSTGVAGFLLQHALQGWCPPITLLRRLGVRTRREIDREKYALQTLLDLPAATAQGGLPAQIRKA